MEKTWATNVAKHIELCENYLQDKYAGTPFFKDGVDPSRDPWSLGKAAARLLCNALKARAMNKQSDKSVPNGWTDNHSYKHIDMLFHLALTAVKKDVQKDEIETVIRRYATAVARGTPPDFESRMEEFKSHSFPINGAEEISCANLLIEAKEAYIKSRQRTTQKPRKFQDKRTVQAEVKPCVNYTIKDKYCLLDATKYSAAEDDNIKLQVVDPRSRINENFEDLGERNRIGDLIANRLRDIGYEVKLSDAIGDGHAFIEYDIKLRDNQRLNLLQNDFGRACAAVNDIKIGDQPKKGRPR